MLFVAITGGCLFSSTVNAQVSTPEPLGLPGDNLNLYGVLDLFQKSPTLEEFEKKLNSEESKINNLDLNGNNMIDYINVKDNVNGDAHAIVLQVAVSANEMQDVAVIQVEKNKDGNILIQIIGNEQLYGKDYIIEPNDQTKNNNSGGTPNPGYKGNTTVVTNNYYTNNYNNDGGYSYYANDWGIVRFIFSAFYVVWISPYYWGFYPSYWYTWTPYYWHSYAYYHHYHCGYYYNNYCRSNIYRNTNCNAAYETCRRTSESVKGNVNNGKYNDTYSKPHLASKEGPSPKGNQLSHSTFESSRVDKVGPKVSDNTTKEISNGNSGKENGSSNNSGVSGRESSSSSNNGYSNSKPSNENSSSGNTTYSNSRPTKESSSSGNSNYSNSRPNTSSGNSGSGRHRGSYSRGSSGGSSSSGSHSSSRGSGGYKNSGSSGGSSYGKGGSSHSSSRNSGGGKPSGSSRSGGGSQSGKKLGVGGRR